MAMGREGGSVWSGGDYGTSRCLGLGVDARVLRRKVGPAWRMAIGCTAGLGDGAGQGNLTCLDFKIGVRDFKTPIL